MPSTFLGLNTTKSGLNYYQASLNTTAHNVSNASTKGYSRQEIGSQASSAIRMGTSEGMQGTGVKVTGVNQIRNTYYDTKYWNSNSLKGQYSTLYDYNYEVETYFNEMNSATGYTSLLTNLQNSMKDLADDPSSTTTRVSYLNNFQTYTQLFNELGTNLQNTQRSLNDELVVRVNRVNAIAKEIFSLGEQITSIELREGNANDLRDQRALLVDELSEIVNVETQEDKIISNDGFETGATRYIVRIDGELLVDDVQYKQLMAVPRDKKVNETDILGLYELAWRNADGTAGDEFDIYSPTLKGNLAALIQMRDGNNNYGFVGTYSEVGTDATKGVYVKMTTDKPFTMEELNINSAGMIQLYDKEYYYDGFEGEVDPTTGEITSYTFYGLKQKTPDGASMIPADTGVINSHVGYSARVGEHVDYQGIPYYMQKLNEFIRTFSEEINDVVTSGVDLYGDAGEDMLISLGTDGNPLDLKSTRGATTFDSKEASYYRLNALNWEINDNLLKDPKKAVVSDANQIKQGNVENCDLLQKIQGMLTDTTIFKQGTPSSYLESLVSNMGQQTKSAKTAFNHQDNIVYSINYQRLSESSVDSNEEAASLLTQQNGYNLACKVMAVLDEIYDKLINQTGV